MVQGPSEDVRQSGAVMAPQQEWKSSRNQQHQQQQQQQQSGDARKQNTSSAAPAATTNAAAAATAAATAAAPASPTKPPGLDMPVLKATARVFEPNPSPSPAAAGGASKSFGAPEYGGSASKASSGGHYYPDPTATAYGDAGVVTGGSKYSNKQQQQHVYASDYVTGAPIVSPRDANNAYVTAAPSAAGYGVIAPQDMTLDAYGMPVMYGGYHPHHYADGSTVYADPNAYGDSSMVYGDYHHTAEGVPMAYGSGTVWYPQTSELPPTGTVYYPPPPPTVTSSSTGGYYDGSTR